MIAYEITCERLEPLSPEAYVCAKADANKLAMGPINDKRPGGCKIQYRDAIKDAPGIIGRAFAIVTVQAVKNDA